MFDRCDPDAPQRRASPPGAEHCAWRTRPRPYRLALGGAETIRVGIISGEDGRCVAGRRRRGRRARADVEPVPFNDYTQPNEALDGRDRRQCVPAQALTSTARSAARLSYRAGRLHRRLADRPLFQEPRAVADLPEGAIIGMPTIPPIPAARCAYWSAKASSSSATGQACWRPRRHRRQSEEIW